MQILMFKTQFIPNKSDLAWGSNKRDYKYYLL